MKRSRWLAAAAAVAVLTAVTVFVPMAGADGGNSVTLAAGLKGTNEVPPVSIGDPDGAGYALIRIKRPALGEVCVEDIALGGIGTPVAYHIHRGRAGTNGPVVIDFTPLLATGSLTGCVSLKDPDLTDAEVRLLRAIASNPDGYYLNVHTTEFPGGAIRGQLVTVVL